MPGSSGKANVWAVLAPSGRTLRAYQLLVLVLVFLGWYVAYQPDPAAADLFRRPQ